MQHYLQDADGLCTQLVKSLSKQSPQPPLTQISSTSVQPQLTNPQITTQLLQQKSLPPQIQNQPPQIQLQGNNYIVNQMNQLQSQPNQTIQSDNGASSFLAPQAFVDAGLYCLL